MSGLTQFKDIIESARSGDERSISLARKICKVAINAAPADDMLEIADLLYHIRRRVHLDAIESN